MRIPFALAGARIAPVRVDLRRDRRSTTIPVGAKVICVCPSHQFPLGMPLSSRRRRALLRFAEQTGAVIVEDDYDGEFRYDGSPIEALRSTASSGHVCYVGSFFNLSGIRCRRSLRSRRGPKTRCSEGFDRASVIAELAILISSTIPHLLLGEAEEARRRRDYSGMPSGNWCDGQTQMTFAPPESVHHDPFGESTRTGAILLRPKRTESALAGILGLRRPRRFARGDERPSKKVEALLRPRGRSEDVSKAGQRADQADVLGDRAPNLAIPLIALRNSSRETGSLQDFFSGHDLAEVAWGKSRGSTSAGRRSATIWVAAEGSRLSCQKPMSKSRSRAAPNWSSRALGKRLHGLGFFA